MYARLSRVALTIALACLSVSAAGGERPNIVLILLDDVGYSDLGAFGGEITTPNLDALALKGVRFSNFHTASSCAPTRAMLLTGVSSHSAGIGSMRELMPLSHRGEPGYRGVLNDRVTTIATDFRAAGYRTAVAGKWHVGHERENLPPARGFDDSFIQADSGSDNFELRPYLPMTPEANWYDNGRRLETLPPDFYSSTGFTDRIINFLSDTEGEEAPFFAYLAYQANHTPLQSPAEFLERYRGRYAEGWAAVRQKRIARLREQGFFGAEAEFADGPSQASWEALSDDERYFEARRMQAYAAMATAMDHEVGRLLSYLRETGQYDNTVFVVLSDNGAVANEPYDNPVGARWLRSRFHRDVERLGEKGSWVAAGRHWGRVANTPLAGVKFSASEGGVRVPLFVSGVPGAASGEISKDFVYVTDIAPTMLALAGISPARSREEPPMTGASLLPHLTGARDHASADNRTVGYEFSGGAALYRGDYKLVRNVPPHGDREWRLFNLARDPGETRDLAATEPARFASMQDEYRRWADANGVLEMPEDYSLVSQVVINTLLFFYLPRYAVQLTLVIAGVVALVYVIRRRRRSTSRAR